MGNYLNNVIAIFPAFFLVMIGLPLPANEIQKKNNNEPLTLLLVGFLDYVNWWWWGEGDSAPLNISKTKWRF